MMQQQTRFKTYIFFFFLDLLFYEWNWTKKKSHTDISTIGLSENLKLNWNLFHLQKCLKQTKVLRSGSSSRHLSSSLSTLSVRSSTSLSSEAGRWPWCLLSACQQRNPSMSRLSWNHWLILDCRLVGRPGSYLYVFESYRMEEVRFIPTWSTRTVEQMTL